MLTAPEKSILVPPPHAGGEPVGKDDDHLPAKPQA